jgi:hypothetical protein
MEILQKQGRRNRDLNIFINISDHDWGSRLLEWWPQAGSSALGLNILSQQPINSVRHHWMSHEGGANWHLECAVFKSQGLRSTD